MSTTSTENNPSLSLIFVNYRSGEFLKQALKTLREKEKNVEYEVIVVNNDPRESAYLSSLESQYQFTLIECASNEGFGAGANRGARQARASIIGFLNPDLIWREKILPTISDYLNNNVAVGVVGIQLLTPGGQPEAWSYGTEPSLFGILLNNFWPRSRSVQAFKSVAVARDWVSGGALFTRKEVFQKLGGFDENFFLYFEDVDFCRRARDEGYTVRLLPRLSVTHEGGMSQVSLTQQKKIFYQSQAHYFQKYSPLVSYWFLRILRFLRHQF